MISQTSQYRDKLKQSKLLESKKDKEIALIAQCLDVNINLEKEEICLECYV